MVIRVVSAIAVAAIACPALAADKLSYDIANFSQSAAQGPQMGYDMGGLLYERTPDHVALGYRLEGLTGSIPAYRVIREVGPLEYELRGLLFAQAGAAMGAGAP